MTIYHQNYENVVRQSIEKLGKKIVFAVPLGIGKPIGLINAFYRAALADPTIDLTIITALTLSRPVYADELEERFVDPLLDRMLGDYEDPLYEKPRVLQQLPRNINVIEFFLSPGKYLQNNYVQQNYINTSYTNVVRDCLAQQTNIIAQQVAPSATEKNTYSLSSNSDVFADMAAGLKAKMGQQPFSIIAEINANLPFMHGDAIVHDDLFTDIIDTKKYRALFAMPTLELSPADHMIGLYVSALVKDDGCIQLGIGEMSNAVSEALILRQENNSAYQHLLKHVSLHDKFSDVMTYCGDTKPFAKGLYASTEMLSDGYLHLIEKGVIKKKVYDDIALQKLADKNPNAKKLANAHGNIMHSAFFLGTNDFYQRLRAMPETLLRSINMTAVAKTNDLLLNPELYKLQRKCARFVNSAMMVTLGGVLISDGLKDMQEVSGVGGQFNFFDMASRLDDSRSIVTCHATRKSKNGVGSNIVWNYTNFTIPRYLRDIVVTEYGIADCRSKTDAEIIKAILNITDSRFQNKLLSKAKRAGKIPQHYQIPRLFKNNYPKVVNAAISSLRAQGYCKPYPFGTELTPEEIRLQRVLLILKYSNQFERLIFVIKSFCHFSNTKKYQPYLQRMKLLNPKNIREFIYKKLLCYLLSTIT